jgi:hypothetical protein
MQQQLFGLVAPVRIRHVYAADRVSVQLLDLYGESTRDDLTIQLPCVANHVMRRSDPPLPVLRLYDPGASDGHTAMAPGPCPEARRFTERQLRAAAGVVCHIPIPNGNPHWLEGLQPGAIERGELYLIRPAEAGEMRVASGERRETAGCCSLLATRHSRLSSLLIAAEHAREQQETRHDAA